MKPMLDALFEVLARNAGNVLTEELRSGILFFMAEHSERSRPAAVQYPKVTPAPMAFRDMVFWRESIESVIEEIKPLHLAHWQETEKYRAGLPFNPDYQAFIAAEQAGRYVLFTVRDAGGRLVGNCALYLNWSTHTGTLVAKEDTLFLLPDARKGGVAKEFVEYIENALSDAGVREVRLTVKTVNKVGMLMQRWGYAHVANELVKVLGGGNEKRTTD